jgi:hypothetical protein
MRVDQHPARHGSDLDVDREGAELAAFKLDLAKMMRTGIAVDLSKRLVTASASGPAHRPPHEHAWLIRGEFVRVNQGSRLLRGAIGFGAGATKLETEVRVYNLSGAREELIMSFGTTGGSNAEPGAITSFATDPLTLAIQAAAGGAGNIAHGLTEDTKRTAREITAQLSDYMYRHHWISDDLWVKPKISSD